MLSEKDLKYLDWVEYGAGLFSTCAKRQFMAVVLSSTGRVIGTGYNGGPSGFPHCTEGACPRLDQNSKSGTAYDNCIALHAEQNALLFSDRTLRVGGTLYVNGTPCSWCAKEIGASGLTRLVCTNDHSFDSWPESRTFLQTLGVTVDESVLESD